MSILKEFKEFAMRGNVVDMAVGIVIGAAFGKIVSSLVADLIMPVVGFVSGGVDFSNHFLVLGSGTFDTLEAAKAAGVATVNYGVFLTVLLDFVIVAFALFMLIKVVNRMTRKKPAPPADPTTKKCPECAMEIPIQAKRCGHCTAAIAA